MIDLFFFIERPVVKASCWTCSRDWPIESSSNSEGDLFESSVESLLLWELQSCASVSTYEPATSASSLKFFLETGLSPVWRTESLPRLRFAKNSPLRKVFFFSLRSFLRVNLSESYGRSMLELFARERLCFSRSGGMLACELFWRATESCFHFFM